VVLLFLLSRFVDDAVLAIAHRPNQDRHVGRGLRMTVTPDFMGHLVAGDR
jgi:hypothetical protein